MMNFELFIISMGSKGSLSPGMHKWIIVTLSAFLARWSFCRTRGERTSKVSDNG